MGRIDLHVHSRHSNDGEKSIEEILGEARAVGIDVISVTDHNCVRGVAPMILKAPQYRVKVIPGIEIDCIHQGKNLHLLGYMIDHRALVFEKLKLETDAMEKATVRKKVKNLRKMGFPLTLEEVRGFGGDQIPTGELFAEILLRNPENLDLPELLPYRKGGLRADNPYLNFYYDFLAPGKPAHVPIPYMDLLSAIKLVKEQGGISVLAHPKPSLGKDWVFLQEIFDLGVQGLEVFTSYHSQDDSREYLSFLGEKSVRFTSGSDYHGKNKPKIRLGDVGCLGYEKQILEFLGVDGNE